MSTTVLDVAQRIRGRLTHRVRTDINLVNSSINSSVTSLTMTYTPNRNTVVGSILSAGFEAMRVVSVDYTTKAVGVVRGYYGTTPTAHDAGAEIEIDSPFSLFRIVDAMQEEVLSFGDKLFRVETVEVVVPDSTETVEIPVGVTDMIGLLSVRRSSPDTDNTAWPSVPVRFQRATSDWSGAANSGKLLRFLDGSLGACTLAITVARPIDVSVFDASTDLVTIGVPASAVDVVGLGTRIRLLIDSEMAADTRGAMDDQQRAQERPPGQWPGPVQSLYALYRRRLQEEADRLRSLYPMQVVG